MVPCIVLCLPRDARRRRSRSIPPRGVSGCCVIEKQCPVWKAPLRKTGNNPGICQACVSRAIGKVARAVAHSNFPPRVEQLISGKIAEEEMFGQFGAAGAILWPLGVPQIMPGDQRPREGVRGLARLVELVKGQARSLSA